MKKLEFETSKGRFLVVDAINGANIHTGISLKDITEEQTSEIVSFEEEYNRSLYGYAKNKLHSLLKSKGVHLFKNPYKNHQDKDLETWYEELTFHNPYIFKL